MASGNVIPSNGADINQTSQGFPSVAVQVSGAIPNLQYGAQQLGTFTTAPQQGPQKGPLERFLNAEIKVLGTVQIMIGLMHIGFVAVAICLALAGYIAWSAGYSFWGGIFFISSGSLCISVAKNENRSLVKCCVGMNITSAIIALIGILQYIFEMATINSFSLNSNSEDWAKNVGICLSSVLFLFRLLEFVITVSLAHFGCQAACCGNDPFITSGSLCITAANSQNRVLNAIDSGLSVVLLLFSLLEFCITVLFAHFGCQTNCCADNQPALVFVPYQVNRDATVTGEPNQHFPPAYI